MNKVMRAVLAALLMVSLLAAHSGFAETMTVEAPTASDPVAASLPDEYLEGLEGLEEIITQESEPEITEEPTAAPTAVPIPTEEPMETESPYTVSFVLPNGWTNTAKATVTIRITDSGNIGLQQAEYSLGNGWNDVTTEYFLSRDGKIDITVTENGTLNVRLTDPHGHVFEESTDVRAFDRTEPALQANIQSD